MSAFEKVMERVERSVEQTLQREASSRVVLEQIVREGAPIFMAYKMRGRIPDIDNLEHIATKILAIVVATEEARR